MLDILSDIQKENQVREFVLAKRLALDTKTFNFVSSIYNRLLEKVQSITTYKKTDDPRQSMMNELRHRLLSQRLFAHTETTRRRYTDAHGSVGERSVLFFEQLPKKSNAYFDIIFTTLGNAIYQYGEGGLISLYSKDEACDKIHETRQSRRPSTLPLPRVYELSLLPEERVLYDSDYATYHSRGEHVFQLAACAYTERAKRLNAPVFTGLSGETYTSFKFLTTFLKLNENEFIQLRKAFVAYLVSSHDHALIEVLDSINYIFEESDFSKAFPFDTNQFHIKLETPNDYQNAFLAIFEDVIMDDKTMIQKNCAELLSDTPSPWFEQAIESHLLKKNTSKATLQTMKDQTRAELLSIFSALKQANIHVLCGLLLEDQQEASITTMLSIVNLYCHSKYSQLPLKLLSTNPIMHGVVDTDTTTEQAKLSAALIKNFGLSSTQSEALLDYPKLAAKAGFADVPQWEKQIFHGDGAILSNKNHTPLLNIIWIMASVAAKHDVFLVRNNHGIGEKNIFTSIELFEHGYNRPSMLCLEVYVLHLYGYKISNKKDHGLAFIPPTALADISPVDVFSKLYLLMSMNKDELIHHMNQLFTNSAPSKLLCPTDISEQTAKDLFDFFKFQTELDVNLWEAGKSYLCCDNSSWVFPCTVIQRGRKGGHGVRYEFISNRAVGEGYTSTVYDVEGTLAIGEQGAQFKQHGAKERIVKVQQHTQALPKTNAILEYEMTQRAGHLAVKPPTFVGDTSYIVMRKLQGEKLYTILIDDLNDERILSLEERLLLSQALLKALKQQVTDKGIIHRDIKGQNVMVDMTHRPILVTIFDYGFAVSTDNPGLKLPGTRAYTPPELLGGEGAQTSGIDVYSMARVLALLWHVDVSSYLINENEALSTTRVKASNVRLDTLFTGLIGLSDDHKTIIRETLYAMLRTDIDARISIGVAIDAFSRITVNISPSLVTARETIGDGLVHHGIFRNTSSTHPDEQGMLNSVVTLSETLT